MIRETIENKLTDLIAYMKANQERNQYVEEEISVYDYSVIISNLEQLLEEIQPLED